MNPFSLSWQYLTAQKPFQVLGFQQAPNCYQYFMHINSTFISCKKNDGSLHAMFIYFTFEANIGEKSVGKYDRNCGR